MNVSHHRPQMQKRMSPVDWAHRELSDDVSHAMIAEPKGSRPEGGGLVGRVSTLAGNNPL